MKIIIKLIVLISLFPIVLKGQSKNDSLKNRSIIITTSILNYIPNPSFNTGNFNIGMDFLINSNKSIYFNLGYIHSYGASGSGIFEIGAIKSNGYSFQLEGRYFLNKHKLIEPLMLIFWPHVFQYNSEFRKNTGYYFSIQSRGKQLNTERRDVNSNSIYFVDTKEIGLNLKMGYQCIKSSGFTIDYSVGFGGRYISSNSSLSENNYNAQFVFPWGRPFDKGEGFYPSFIYQVNLGWAF